MTLRNDSVDFCSKGTFSKYEDQTGREGFKKIYFSLNINFMTKMAHNPQAKGAKISEKGLHSLRISPST